MSKQRIVSLIPSATEIVAGLGFEDRLVGRSHECDTPEGIAELPALTAPKFDVNGSSGQIDDRVRDLVQRGLSVYQVDAATLEGLNPDLIVTQDQCEVCAASLSEIEAALGTTTGLDVDVVSLKPLDLADALVDMQRVADAIGEPSAGERLVGALRARLDEIAASAKDASYHPRIALIEWVDPLMAAGNWMPELARLAGAEPVLGEAGAHSPWIEWDDVRAADADIIAVMPCGYGIERTLGEMDLLTAQPGWSDLRAVRDGRVFVIDGNHYFNRPGPRLVESCEILAEICHPGRFDFGHGGRGWVPFPPKAQGRPS